MIHDQRSIPHLLAYLAQHEEEQFQDEVEVRNRVRETLIHIGTSYPSLLIKAVQEGNTPTKVEATHALLQIGTKDAIDVMITALEDLNYVVRLNAAAYLGKWGDERVINPLNQSLKDVNRDVIIMGWIQRRRDS
jgi:HEAT repeat protein